MRWPAVTTIEGLASGGELHPVQAAFVRHDALQCGYCTPGQIMSAVALLAEGRAGSDDDIREFMSGNLCRCGAYPNIVAAIREVARTVSGWTFDTSAPTTSPRPSPWSAPIPAAQYLAGGTTQLDLTAKTGVLSPERLVDITRLPLRGIDPRR